jgi:uncharacterized membrane protein
LDARGAHAAAAPVANLNSVAKIETDQLLARTTAERLGDTVARVAGSGGCAIAHALIFGGWLLVNLGFVPILPPFDPYPFAALTMAVSLEAIFLTLFVLISQNRMMRQADRRTHLDLQVNLLAEQESTATLRLLHRISDHLGMSPEPTGDEAQLEGQTDVERLAAELDRRLPG